MNKHDKELDKMNKDINNIKRDLMTKMDHIDGKKIWKHFQRFAEYDDLKDLYKRTMPEIMKFEERLMEY